MSNTNSTTSSPSNTLVISGFDKETAEDTSFLTSLKCSIQETCQVEILEFVLIKSFRRIISVFHDEEDCERVKDYINNTTYPPEISTLKAFFTVSTLLDEQDERRRLQLPDRGRLWLISPPPSPPVGWESITEGEPNQETHHPALTTINTSFLHEALSRVALDGNTTPTTTAAAKSKPTSTSPERPTITRRFTLRESSSNLTLDGLTPLNTESTPTSTSPGSTSPLTPSIVLEWDDDGEEDPNPLAKPRSYFPRTEMPPPTAATH